MASRKATGGDVADSFARGSIQEFWSETLQRIKARAESADQRVESADHVEQDVSRCKEKGAEGEPAIVEVINRCPARSESNV